jgi:hypothetical protein
VEDGWAAMALEAYALEQSERERTEGEQMGEGEGHRLGLHNCVNPRRRVGARGHALGVFCPGHLPLPVALNGETEEKET